MNDGSDVVVFVQADIEHDRKGKDRDEGETCQQRLEKFTTCFRSTGRAISVPPQCCRCTRPDSDHEKRLRHVSMHQQETRQYGPR